MGVCVKVIVSWLLRGVSCLRLVILRVVVTLIAFGRNDDEQAEEDQEIISKTPTKRKRMLGVKSKVTLVKESAASKKKNTIKKVVFGEIK